MGIMCLGIQTIKINQKYVKVKSLLAIQAIQANKELEKSSDFVII